MDNSEQSSNFVADAADLLCPELTFQQRLIGFASCFSIACEYLMENRLLQQSFCCVPTVTHNEYKEIHSTASRLFEVLFYQKLEVCVHGRSILRAV